MISIPALVRLVGGAAIVAPLLWVANVYMWQAAPAPEKPLSPQAAVKPVAQPLDIAPMPGPSPGQMPGASSAPIAGNKPPSQPTAATAFQPQAPMPTASTGRAARDVRTQPTVTPSGDPPPLVVTPTIGPGRTQATEAKPVTPATRPLLAREQDPVTAEPDETPAAVGAARGSAGCQNYKSYDPATQTYRSFDGKTLGVQAPSPLSSLVQRGIPRRQTRCGFATLLSMPPRFGSTGGRGHRPTASTLTRIERSSKSVPSRALGLIAHEHDGENCHVEIAFRAAGRQALCDLAKRTLHLGRHDSPVRPDEAGDAAIDQGIVPGAASRNCHPEESARQRISPALRDPRKLRSQDKA